MRGRTIEPGHLAEPKSSIFDGDKRSCAFILVLCALKNKRFFSLFSPKIPERIYLTFISWRSIELYAHPGWMHGLL